MRLPFLALIFALCGLAATASARPHTVPDALVAVGNAGQGLITLEATGASVLAGIVMMDAPATQAELKKLHAVEVKSLGLDRYGRHRILLYSPGAAEAVQESLLRSGRAILFDQVPSVKSWKAAEADAQENRRGCWADNAWQITPEEAAQAQGAFRRVAGTVTRVYAARDAYYINFGDNWKTDFSAKIPRRNLRSFGKNFSVAPGTYVAVRGTIISENGPMIVLTRPEQLEMPDAHP